MAAFPERVPRARTADLVTTEVGAEVLVYDQLTHHIHHLNATSATVWRRCDGQHSVAEIALGAGMSEAVARAALTKLADVNLLDGNVARERRVTGHSRRQFMKRAAVAWVAVPVIVSVSAPRAAAGVSAVCDLVCETGSHCEICPGSQLKICCFDCDPDEVICDCGCID